MPLLFGNPISTITGKPEPSMEEKVFLGKAIFNNIKETLFPPIPKAAQEMQTGQRTLTDIPRQWIDRSAPNYQESLFMPARPFTETSAIDPADLFLPGISGSWKGPLDKFQKFMLKNNQASIDDVMGGAGITRHQAENLIELMKANKGKLLPENRFSANQQSVTGKTPQPVGGIVLKSEKISSNELTFREHDQVGMDEIRKWLTTDVDSDLIPPITTVKTQQGFEILDGHNRAKVAGEVDKEIPHVSISKDVYDNLREQGFDSNEISYAMLTEAGELEAAQNVWSQWQLSIGRSGDRAHEALIKIVDESLPNQPIPPAGAGLTRYQAENLTGLAKKNPGLIKKVKPTKTDYLHKATKKYFGVTDDINEAGYILKDGEMLDFSGKNQGGTPGVRAFDHREVQFVDDVEYGGVKEIEGFFSGDSNTANMRKFMDETSAIRVSVQRNGSANIDIKSNPNKSQLKRIKEIADKSDEIYVDITGDRRETIGGNTYWDTIAAKEFGSNSFDKIKKFIDLHLKGNK